MSKKYIEPGKRLMDLAYIRDGSLVHTGEALVLALLIHTRGRTNRGADEVKHLAAMLDDPNIEKKPRRSRKR
jgi:predicted RecA/RadA family phage recombinase